MKDGNRIAKRMLRLEPNNFFLLLTSMQKRLLHSKPSSKKKMKKRQKSIFCPKEQLRCFSPSAKKSSILSDLTNLKTELLLMKLKEESSGLHKWHPDIFEKKHISVMTLGIGGGASGRTTAFYLASRVRILGRTWFFGEWSQSILAGCRAFSKECVIKWWIPSFSLLSSFLSSSF